SRAGRRPHGGRVPGHLAERRCRLWPNRRTDSVEFLACSRESSKSSHAPPREMTEQHRGIPAYVAIFVSNPAPLHIKYDHSNARHMTGRTIGHCEVMDKLG